jgi:hypothetical protein
MVGDLILARALRPALSTLAGGSAGAIPLRAAWSWRACSSSLGSCRPWLVSLAVASRSHTATEADRRNSVSDVTRSKRG